MFHCTDLQLHPALYSRAALTILLVQSLCTYITYPVLILSYILYYTPELHSLFCWCSHCVHTLHYLSCTDPELHPVLYSRAALTILLV